MFGFIVYYEDWEEERRIVDWIRLINRLFVNILENFGFLVLFCQKAISAKNYRPYSKSISLVVKLPFIMRHWIKFPLEI